MAGRPPRYLELAEQLVARWQELPPGTLVESEHQLADEFGVARLTAREAVREVERRLVVRRVVGRGTFTAHRVEYPVALGGVPSFRQVLTRADHSPGVEPVSRRWRGRGADRGYEVERLLTIDGLVGSFTIDRFAGELAKQVAGRLGPTDSVIDTLTDLGTTPRRAGVRVALALPEPEIVRALDYPSAAPPLWRLDSTTRDGDAGPIIHRSTAWMRPDMFEVIVLLGDDVAP